MRVDVLCITDNSGTLTVGRFLKYGSFDSFVENLYVDALAWLCPLCVFV